MAKKINVEIAVMVTSEHQARRRKEELPVHGDMFIAAAELGTSHQSS